MPAQTPMRVRGKRSATPCEKWNHGKRRNFDPGPSPDRSDSSTSSSDKAQSRHQRKRKRPPRELSALEQLPTEIIHSIFVLSGNVELAMASPVLASQLASQHLQHELATVVLPAALYRKDSSMEDLERATRLMDCKFFTLKFLKDWLLRGLHPTDPRFEEFEKFVLFVLDPHPDFLPPPKLLRSPSTADHWFMLARITPRSSSPARRFANPAYEELGRDALERAIMEGVTEPIAPLGRLGFIPEQRHLRMAILNAGCNESMFRTLLQSFESFNKRMFKEGHDIDLLDPCLWAWAEEEGAQDKRWVRAMLRETLSRLRKQRNEGQRAE